MWRRTAGCIVTLTLSILAMVLAATAQPAGKIPRIGWLYPGARPAGPNPFLEAFREDLRNLGYVEGQNLVIEDRYAEGNLKRFPDLAAELVRLQVDIIVAGNATAARAASQATERIPIVVAGGDAVGTGLITNLARPGGNITGLSLLMAELPGKGLELLKEAVPQSARVAVLGNPADPTYEARMNNLRMAAQALGLHLHVMEVRRADELDTAFAAMTREGADALIVLPDVALMDPLHGRIAALATQRRLPAMYGWRAYVEAGGLMAYGPSLRDMWRRAAIYVDKLLKGAKPAELPVEQPTKFELVLNRKTAQALGITFPPTLLVLADELIQ